MIRIAPGQSWKLNPGYLAALREVSARAATALGESPGILDALRIEVDGVPLGRGLGEGDLIAAVDELVAACLRLCRDPAGGGQVSLGDGKVELVLGRRGERARLALVRLARPAHLVAGELEVDLGALARAAAACAEALAADLRAVNPRLAAAPLLRRLERGAEALRKAAALAGGRAPRPAEASPLLAAPARPPPVGPAVRLLLQDEDGRMEGYRGGADLYALLGAGEVELMAPGGPPLWRASGPPFLALTDLARAAAEIVSAARAGERSLEVALPGGGALGLRLPAGPADLGGRALDASPLALARAFFEAALDFTGALCARNPRFEKNPYLASLTDGAREPLRALRELEGGDLFAEPASARARATTPPAPGAPLSPHGPVRRLRYEVAWRAAMPFGPARALAWHRRALAALGEEGLAYFDPRTGAALGEREGRAVLGPRGAVRSLGARLEGLDFAGRSRWMRESRLHGAPRPTACFGGCRAGPSRAPAELVGLDGPRLAALLCETGRVAWEIEPPQVHRLVAAAHGDRVFAAADSGVLYGLDASTGAVAFRVRTGAAPEGGLAVSGGRLCLVGREGGALWLIGLDCRTGHPRFRVPLGLDAAGEPLRVGRRLLVAGARAGEPTVLGFTGAGRPLFEIALAARGGAPAALADRGRVFLSLRDGSLHAVAASGALLWSQPGGGAELARPLAPRLHRGVVFAPGDPVRALDPDSGALLAELPPAHGLCALAVGPRLELFTADDGGVVTCLHLATHLSVVGA